MKKVIKFSTSSCAPCQTYKPIFQRVASQVSDCEFEEVDCHSNPEYARSFGVRGVPATIFLQDGQEVNRIQGLIEEDRLISTIQNM